METQIKYHRLYFLGIGGIGMSALARYFNNNEFTIFGYDRTRTELTIELEAEGMHIHYNEDIKLIPNDIDFVVYTPAIPKDSIELNFFKQENFTLYKRAQVLGIISKMQKTIAVAGTHGKTTTSSIITHLLLHGGVKCTAFLGGIMNDYQTNYIGEKGEWVVVEADEFDRSFLHLKPHISVLNSMDADHLDIYHDHDNMLNSFQQFLELTAKDGNIYYKKELSPDINFNTLNNYASFSSTLESADIKAKNINVKNGWFHFDYVNKDLHIDDLKFSLPGRHNIENAIVAITVALQLGVSVEDIRDALIHFKGIKRRFDFAIRTDSKVLIDDYAHHPTELKAAITAARDLYPDKRITGIFQPHLFTRTRDFVDGFGESLSLLDKLILLDIYPARELPIEGVTSKIIFDKVDIADKTLINKSELLELITQINLELEVVLILGAGDIDTFVKPIKELMKS